MMKKMLLAVLGAWVAVQPHVAAGQAGTDRQAESGRFPDRPFARVRLDTLTWTATEGNTLGVQSAVVEGDVMSRPHLHPDERRVLVLRGTWYTGEGKDWTPEKGVGLKPGDDMRHPAGGLHWDGALDEDVLVAISGYGPTSATVIDGGNLFGRAR